MKVRPIRCISAKTASREYQMLPPQSTIARETFFCENGRPGQTAQVCFEICEYSKTPEQASLMIEKWLTNEIDTAEVAKQIRDAWKTKGETIEHRDKLKWLLLKVEDMRRCERSSLRDCADYIIANGFVDLSHVMLLDVDEGNGSVYVSKVVLYNKNHVTKEEALRTASVGEYHPSVLTLSKHQWASLFLNREEA